VRSVQTDRQTDRRTDEIATLISRDAFKNECERAICKLPKITH